MIREELMNDIDASFAKLKKTDAKGEENIHFHGFLDGYEAGRERTTARAKEAFDKACGWLSTYPWYQGVVEEFVKALEERQ